jgi:hypothetical protein
VKKILGAILIAGATVLGGVPAAQAGSATDAALGLGAFAVFNQFVRGETVFHGLFGAAPVVVAPPPVIVQQPVVVAPPPPVYYPPPAPVYYAPRPPVVYAPAPVYYAPRPGPSGYFKPVPPGYFKKAYGHPRKHHRRH